jgi:PAS domain S-box-containing protein
MTSLRAARGYLLPAVAALAFAVTLAWGVWRINEQQTILFSSETTGSWLATQAEIEHFKFLAALHDFAAGTLPRDDLMLRFEVLWSRFDLILKGVEGQQLREIPGATAAYAGMLQTMTDLEPVVAGLAREDRAAFERVRGAVKAFGPDLKRASQHSLLELRPRYVQRIISESHLWILASLVGVFLSGAVIVAMLVLSMRRARVAGIAAEESRNRLNDAIESLTSGFALYDADDRLELFNRRTMEFFPGMEDVLRPGVAFTDLVRHAAERGLFDAAGSVDAVIARHSALHQDPPGAREVRVGDRWLLVNAHRTRDGGVVVINTDITAQKNAEQALRATEEKFRNLIEGSIAGVVIHRDFKILFANEAWASMHGYTLEEAYALGSILDTSAPEERDRLIRQKERRVAGEPMPAYFEVRSLRKDGSRLWVGVMARVVSWDDGPAIQLTTIDVTLRKAAEERFEKAFHASPDIVTLTDPADGRVFDINRSGLATLGYAREDIVGRSALDLGLWANAADRDRLISALRADRSVHDFEARIRLRSGELRDFLIAAELVEIDGRPRLLLVSRDITDRKRAETALRESEQRFYTAFHASPNMIAIIGRRDGQLYDINENWLRMLGYRRDQIVGNTDFDLDHWSDAEAHAGFYGQVRNAGEVSNFETRLHAADGTIRDFSFSAKNIELGGAPYALIVGDEITERKRTERMKNEFVATVSHELRTPLTSINGALGLLRGGVAGSLPEQSRHLVEIAKSNSDRLVRLINDILDIEKIEAGSMAFRMSAVDLGSAIEAALFANQAYGERYGVSFRIGAGADGIRVRADPDRLDQVLANLLSNAAKFSPRGGTVEIAVGRHDGRIRTEIIDSGPGIPVEIRDRIFEKFVQADASDDRATEGTGLGLSIAKAIVERMGGSIAVRAGAGGGCVFFFDLEEWGDRRAAETGPDGGKRDEPQAASAATNIR